MVFNEAKLPGAFIVELEKFEDPRGFFARAWCKNEFESHGLASTVMQANLSYNRSKATLRGMHYQIEPFAETKLLRCISGAIYDVIIDLRPASKTYKQWLGVELSAKNRKMIYVPQGFAHGFISLESNTEVLYHVSQFYSQCHERGVRYDDPAFGIEWPLGVEVISEKDRSWPDFSE
jgi:dTDP-4-dehydrorhamnose 3,5-epimerase